jgi:Ca-activated chloride channel family protein
MKFNPLYSWHQIQAFFTFEWENSLFLYGLIWPFIVYFIKYLRQRGNKPRLELSLSVPLRQNRISLFLSYVPMLIQVLCISSVIIVAAGPYRVIKHQKKQVEGIDIALALDISSSMQTRDISPSRLETAKTMGKEFIRQRSHDPISLIAFAGAPYLASPITTDTVFLLHQLQQLQTNQIVEEGTALGDALGMCINQIRDSENPKKISILISDGNNTAGNLDPVTSAELAKNFNIKVYTIAVGSLQPSADPVDESTLREIATLTKGKFFRATNGQALQQIFQEIDKIEASVVKTVTWEEHISLSYLFAEIALVLFFIGLWVRFSWIGNSLED